MRLHQAARRGDPWDFEEVYGALHDFARGLSRSTPSEEDYLVHITTGTHVAQICLFLLTESRHLPGRLLQTVAAAARRSRGARRARYRIIDLDLSQVRPPGLALRGSEAARGRVASSSPASTTRNARVQPAHRADRAGGHALDARRILLTGPDRRRQVAARPAHLRAEEGAAPGRRGRSSRSTAPRSAATRAMSALFGHVKGAFTGAVRDRPGLLRAADGGVLFLDEIGELGPDEQAMLLRAIEEKALPARRRRPGGRAATSSSSPAPTATCGAACARAASARTCWPASTSGPSACRACASGREDIEPNLDYELDQFARRHRRRA